VFSSCSVFSRQSGSPTNESVRLDRVGFSRRI
jgi:hypothetical protein